MIQKIWKSHETSGFLKNKWMHSLFCKLEGVWAVIHYVSIIPYNVKLNDTKVGINIPCPKANFIRKNKSEHKFLWFDKKHLTTVWKQLLSYRVLKYGRIYLGRSFCFLS